MLKVTNCSFGGRCWDLLRRLMGSSIERVSNVPNISFKPAGTLAELSPPNMFPNLKMLLRHVKTVVDYNFSTHKRMPFKRKKWVYNYFLRVRYKS